MSAFITSAAPTRSSSFIEDIDYNLESSSVRVQFKNQDVHFFGVTLDAIQELLNPMTSFGFWFNKYCK
jgi:phage-related protein